MDSGTSNDPMAMTLNATGLRKTFRKGGRELHVLRNVDLSMSPGDHIAIVGASGSGKSTLLHLLGVLDRPDAGLLTFDGVDPFRGDDQHLAEFRNRRIGFIFQFHHLLPDFTALENVMMPAIIAEQPEAEAKKRATELLDLVGLTERLEHLPAELSGGEQQRVAIARALVMSPDLILADEPLGNLDAETAQMVGEMMFTAARACEASLVLVTHAEDLARQLSRTLVLRDGRLGEAA